MSYEAAQRLFGAGRIQAVRLGVADLPALQAFFEANPGYFQDVNGMPPRPDEARIELEDLPPPEMRFDQQYMIGFVDEAGALVGMASLLSEFLAPRVWHIGLFMVATSLHGTGTAAAIYEQLERWMKDNGALWVRLGAVAGNRKAERFWEKAGYTEVRRRTGVLLGTLTHDLRVFVKPLGEVGLNQYLSLVARDRPDSP